MKVLIEWNPSTKDSGLCFWWLQNYNAFSYLICLQWAYSPKQQSQGNRKNFFSQSNTLYFQSGSAIIVERRNNVDYIRLNIQGPIHTFLGIFYSDKIQMQYTSIYTQTQFTLWKFRIDRYLIAQTTYWVWKQSLRHVQPAKFSVTFTDHFQYKV